MKLTSLIYGNFILLHNGHQRLFEFAKSISDKLIIVINSDGILDEDILLNETHRKSRLLKNPLVDEVIILREEIDNLIREIRPNFVIKGAEYKFLNNPEIKAINEVGAKLLFSTNNINEFKDSDTSNVESQYFKTEFIHEYMERHNISRYDIELALSKFNNLNVIVIGDLIVDEYVDCSSVGLSREAPSIVVTPNSQKRYVGGAGIVARHAANLGAQVTLFSLAGKDEAAQFAQQSLDNDKINTYFYDEFGTETIVKKKYFIDSTPSIRVNSYPKTLPGLEYDNQLLRDLKAALPGCDCIIIADFNYGTISSQQVQAILELCKKNKIKIMVDSQSSSQIGKIQDYKNCYLSSVTEYEARLAIHEPDLGPNALMRKFAKVVSAKNVFLKMGKEGFLVRGTEVDLDNDWIEDSIPSLGIKKVDVSGAGDSVLVCSSLSFACGCNIWLSALIGALGAAVQISRQGNNPIKVEELLSFSEL